MIVDPQNGERNGVLALRTFVEAQLAVHGVLAELAAARIDSLLLDVRGNTGGDLCHIYDLAYLLSNQLNSPDDAQERLALHVRQSRMLDDLVYGQSTATGSRIPNAPAGNPGDTAAFNQLDDLCSTDLIEDVRAEAMAAERDKRNASLEDPVPAGAAKDRYRDRALRYRCSPGALDSDFYSCGASPACVGPDAWREGCRACPAKVHGVASSWSRAFRPRCAASARGAASLLEFAAAEGGACRTGGVDGEVLRTSKAWSGCSTCLEQVRTCKIYLL